MDGSRGSATARGVRETVAGLRADEMAVLHLLQGSARRAA